MMEITFFGRVVFVPTQRSLSSKKSRYREKKQAMRNLGVQLVEESQNNHQVKEHMRENPLKTFFSWLYLGTLPSP